MKRYLFFILCCFINIICGYSQINKKFHVVNGTFVCRANQYLIYMENEQIDSEKQTYTIKAINLSSNEKILLSRQARSKCVNMSDTSILYIKGSELVRWNLESKRKTVYLKSDKDLNIIGFGYNKETSNLLLAQINFKTNELFIKILDNRKQILFCQKIKVNYMEMEGVAPVLDTLNNFFILLVQDKLYVIDSKKLEFKLVSDKCDSYALSNGKVIYYKFVTDEKTEGYSFDLITKENKKIDDSLNGKICNCEKSLLFTSNIDNEFIPTYIICNKSYLWVNNNWQITSEVFMYKDKKLIIKKPFVKKAISDNYFQWKLQ